jgi:transposase
MPRPGPRTTARYSEQFKATAVALSQRAGVQVKDVAESLYIHPIMLSRWRRPARDGLIVTKAVKLDAEVAAELKAYRKLKKEHEQLKMEHDLLKEAIAFTSARRAKSSPSSSTVKARTRSE